MFIISWQDGAGTRSAGYPTEREAEWHRTLLAKKGTKNAVVWELIDDQDVA